MKTKMSQAISKLQNEGIILETKPVHMKTMAEWVNGHIPLGVLSWGYGLHYRQINPWTLGNLSQLFKVESSLIATQPPLKQN